MSIYKDMPYSIKLSFQLLMILLIGFFIYIGHGVLVPIYFSVLLSILLLPLTNFLERLHFPRALANLTSVILALTFIGWLIYFLSSQISSFLQDIPSIRHHLTEHYITLQSWIERRFNVSTEDQSAMFLKATEGIKNSGTSYIEQTFFTVTEMMLMIILIAIYSFLILHYRHMIRRFFFAVFNRIHKEKVSEVLLESKHIIQKYMVGLLIEMGIVATANSLVLLIIGVPYAIFLGIFAAILNIIPYVGIFTGIVFTMLVTLGNSSNLSQLVWVLVSMQTIHFIDSNFLMARIVGSKVKINALITIIGVMIGGTLIGLPGIFLALPTIAIMKIIFERIDGLQPWAMLLGDDTRPIANNRMLMNFKKLTLHKKEHPLPTPAKPVVESA